MKKKNVSSIIVTGGGTNYNRDTAINICVENGFNFRFNNNVIIEVSNEKQNFDHWSKIQTALNDKKVEYNTYYENN